MTVSVLLSQSSALFPFLFSNWMILSFRTDRSEQTVSTQRGAIWCWSKLFAIPSASFGCITLWIIHISQLLGYLQVFLPGVRILGVLRYFAQQRRIVSNIKPDEQPHEKTNKVAVCPAKTRISLGIRPVWSESSLSTWRKLGSLATHWAHSEDSDQTGRMPRLIWIFAGCTDYFVGFVVRWLKCWVIFISAVKIPKILTPEKLL